LVGVLRGVIASVHATYSNAIRGIVKPFQGIFYSVEIKLFTSFILPNLVVVR